MEFKRVEEKDGGGGCTVDVRPRREHRTCSIVPRRNGGIPFLLGLYTFFFSFFFSETGVSCFAMPVMLEVGLRDVVPLDQDHAFLSGGDLLECSWREIDGVRVFAGRAIITARQR